MVVSTIETNIIDEQARDNDMKERRESDEIGETMTNSVKAK